MEKVYVLTKVIRNMGCEGYDETKVIGVFNTLVALEAFEKNHPLNGWEYFDYEEFEVQK